MEQDNIEVNVITLENNKDYMVVETIINDNNKYLFLANENDEFDFCIRKVIKKEDKEFLVKLDTEEEYEEVLTLFNEKHRKKEGENEK